MALPNLRRIFSASRTPLQERAVSRQAFFRFVSFLASCVLIALLSSPKRRAVLLGLGMDAAAMASSATTATLAT
ncbi:uncharacterized protein FA14DRAFT_22242 [Meira miltonrushii]|uniref:Uncharacterized protein n=1 Tax=Meira miltonrushii TaxID=1280837 RepID=A0A316VPF9_9BASI|nr:uncharacterized protein FA14DRAFT_22242 [Meira miltonrushii]PWN38031.1 hypothetical protein FA14DRAFT_22242 [Meira miltonrushii]